MTPLNEFTGAGDVAPGVERPLGVKAKTRPVKKHIKLKKPNVTSDILGEADDVVPVLAHPSPILMQRIRQRIRQRNWRLRESNEADSLIPDTATKVVLQATTGRVKPDGTSTSRDNEFEPLIEPSLAIVAPDVTPKAYLELDPSLVPSVDGAISAILGDPAPVRTAPAKPPETKVVDQGAIAPEPVASTESDSSDDPLTRGLPMSEGMPLPAGSFLKPVSHYMGEGTGVSEKPKVELTLKSGPSILGTAALPEQEMPTPHQGDPSVTASRFRKFTRPKT